MRRDRVERDQTGAQWSLRSLAAMDGRGAREMRHRALTEAMLEQQQSGEPVSRWALARLHGAGDWSHGFQTVAQLMSTDLFTAHPDDLVDLAASVMEWIHIRHVPARARRASRSGFHSGPRLHLHDSALSFLRDVRTHFQNWGSQ
jgi:hypothetical protein